MRLPGPPFTFTSYYQVLEKQIDFALDETRCEICVGLLAGEPGCYDPLEL
jgi:hypothetical protein